MYLGVGFTPCRKRNTKQEIKTNGGKKSLQKTIVASESYKILDRHATICMGNNRAGISYENKSKSGRPFP
jgi:hypothetical protein